MPEVKRKPTLAIKYHNLYILAQTKCLLYSLFLASPWKWLATLRLTRLFWSNLGDAIGVMREI